MCNCERCGCGLLQPFWRFRVALFFYLSQSLRFRERYAIRARLECCSQNRAGGANMTIRNLNLLFQPRSVALVGASERSGSIGLHIAGNLLPRRLCGHNRFRQSRPGNYSGKALSPQHRTPSLSYRASPSLPRLRIRYPASLMSSVVRAARRLSSSRPASRAIWPSACWLRRGLISYALSGRTALASRSRA